MSSLTNSELPSPFGGHPVSACQTLEYMTTHHEKKGYDPFVVSSSYTMQRAMLQEAFEKCSRATSADQHVPGLSQLTAPDGLGALRDKRVMRRWGDGTRTSINRQELLRSYVTNVVMAVIGGAFLIVPMAVMVLKPGLVRSLVTTSICVFVFALTMSLSVFFDTRVDVLSATAAYAAVLVVFIGTGGGS